MQPYLFPYQGYFNLMAAADLFIVRDLVQYSKGGWINRNQLEVDGTRRFFTIPLQKTSDYDLIREKRIHSSWTPSETRQTLVSWLGKAPFKSVVAQLDSLNNSSFGKTGNEFLADYLVASLREIADLLGIQCRIVLESEIAPEGTPSGQAGVLDLCSKVEASAYLNAPGGRLLYSTQAFEDAGFELYFVDPKLRPYSRGSREWLPGLSILDLIAHLDLSACASRVNFDLSLSKE